MQSDHPVHTLTIGKSSASIAVRVRCHLLPARKDCSMNTPLCDPLVQVQCYGSAVTVRVCCPYLTEAEAPGLDRELAAVLRGRERPVVTLDLAAVRFLGSMAVGRFVTLNRSIRAARGRLILVNVAPHLRRVFAVCRLDRLFDAASEGPSMDAIRALAYRKWEEAGRPARDGVEFWHMAETEILLGS